MFVKVVGLIFVAFGFVFGVEDAVRSWNGISFFFEIFFKFEKLNLATIIEQKKNKNTFF